MMARPLSVIDSVCSMLLTDGGQAALEVGGDAAFHLLGVHARVLPDGGEDRDIDVRERYRWVSAEMTSGLISRMSSASTINV